MNRCGSFCQKEQPYWAYCLVSVEAGFACSLLGADSVESFADSVDNFADSVDNIADVVGNNFPAEEKGISSGL